MPCGWRGLPWGRFRGARSLDEGLSSGRWAWRLTPGGSSCHPGAVEGWSRGGGCWSVGWAGGRGGREAVWRWQGAGTGGPGCSLGVFWRLPFCSEERPRGGCASEGTRGVWEVSVPPCDVCCEPITTQGNQVFEIKKEKKVGAPMPLAPMVSSLVVAMSASLRGTGKVE